MEFIVDNEQARLDMHVVPIGSFTAMLANISQLPPIFGANARAPTPAEMRTYIRFVHAFGFYHFTWKSMLDPVWQLIPARAPPGDLPPVPDLIILGLPYLDVLNDGDFSEPAKFEEFSILLEKDVQLKSVFTQKYTPAVMSEMCGQLQELIRLKVITKCDTMPKFLSPVIMIKQKNKTRMCINYKALNSLSFKGLLHARSSFSHRRLEGFQILCVF